MGVSLLGDLANLSYLEECSSESLRGFENSCLVLSHKVSVLIDLERDLGMYFFKTIPKVILISGI